MLRNLSSACARCRSAAEHAQHTSKRFRSGLVTKKASPWSSSSHDKQRRPPFNAHTNTPYPYPSHSNRARRSSSPFMEPKAYNVKTPPPETLTAETSSAYFELAVKEWIKAHRTLQRFQQFGFASEDIQPFLAVFVQTAQSGFFSTPTNQVKYQLSRLADYVSAKPVTRQVEAEITFSKIFFSWCLNTEDSAILDGMASQGKINANTLAGIRHLAEVCQRRPAEEYPYARKMQRKFIMHIGPTNSGKTHHALRALAAANTGVYAGPLRLLAHEIWERLNLGQIVPLGVDQPPPNIDSATTSTTPILKDQSIAPQAHKLQNPAYARLTNMITGEEKKLVSEHAALLACTVEMLSTRVQYDVGVIDEIQMIGDSERGFAWTNAVLGLCANEIHLCGEESAVGVVRALLEQTGDELEIRRYERLTPLNVEEKSLGGSYSREDGVGGGVTKGDCVVAFSRTRIFQIKEEIERGTGLRCAVVYGKLPPEIRSEQAALFNDPKSGYDVIVGSDAIGMGLNLKIRRIIFDAVSKTDGAHRIIPLSISQTKQIAGRAGRYGHSLTGEKPGGFTTTLHEKDLPVLKAALAHPSTPTIPYAHIGPTGDTFSRIVTALPPATSLESVKMAHVYVGALPRVYKYSMQARVTEICEWVDEKSQGRLTWAEKQTLAVSPVAWRDDVVVKAAEQMVKMQRDEMWVGIERVLMSSKLGFYEALEYIERLMAKPQDPRTQPGAEGGKWRKEEISQVKDTTLELLESFHKVLVLYMWMHFKNNVVYPDRDKTEDLKHRVEIVMDWALQHVGKRDVAARWGQAAQHRQRHQLQTSKISKIVDAPRSPPTTPKPLKDQQPQLRVPKVDFSSKNDATGPARRWERPPDLSTLLKKYVDSPSLKVGSRNN